MRRKDTGAHFLSPPDRLLDVREAAALLNVRESWIYQHVRERAEDKLPHIKLGKYIRFSTQALTQWLESRQLRDTPPGVLQRGYSERSS